MKRSGLTRRILPATLFLTLIAGASIAAQDPKAGAPEARNERRENALLKRFDKNGDGRIDDDERADAKEMMLKDQMERSMPRGGGLPPGLEPFRAEVLALFDANRDGQIDEQERGVAQRFATKQRELRTEVEDLNRRFDRNADGTIDADERAMIDRFLGELQTLGTAQARMDLLRRFDLNLDGKIDDEEFPELEQFVRPRIEANPLQVRRYDTDKNGSLEPAEWAGARTAILHWLNASGPAAIEPLGLPNAEIMKRVAEEVARRKTQRETNAPAVRPAENMSPVSAEQARLNAVAEEVARRRAERAAAQKSDAPK